MRLHIDKELYRKDKYDAQKLIAAKKQALFDEKLSEGFDTPKELRNTLKCLSMSVRTIVSNSIAIVNNKSLTYDTKTMSKVLKDFLSNLAEYFLAKIADSLNKHNLESVFLYYSNFAFCDEFYIKST